MDLIFAEATPPGRGGVSVIRLSGDGARAAAEALAGPLPEARHAYFRTLRDQDEVLDQALVLWFQHGSSFTGEESCELHLHGAPVIVRRVGKCLLMMGARPAVAGEFTRRAFINGRMDLAEIQGLGDLLAAETEAQRKLAVLTASGQFTQRVAHWRDLILRAGGLTEASIDFADEDVPEDVPREVYDLAAQLAAEIDEQIRGFDAAEQIRQGFEVAIVGPPNAGKSSLLNAMARRDVAIVSDIAGTTRDVIELRLDLNGLAVTFLDTAGIRVAGDAIERLGVERAQVRAEAADLRIHLSDDGRITDELWKDGDLVVRSKSDLREVGEGLMVSGTTGAGISALLGRISDILSSRVSGAGLVSHEQQLGELLDAKHFVTEIIDEGRPEIVAECLRSAAAALDRVVGKIDADHFLDVVFSSFCIGK